MANGVWHTKLGIEIDLTQQDLGHPEMPGLWEVLYDDKRPVPSRGLQCLQCRQERPHCPEWMFLRIRNGVRQAVHFNTSIGAHAGETESDEHKALKERIYHAGDHEGFRVTAEDRSRDGKRRTDVTVTGDVSVGWEIQLSNITAGTVQRRARIAREDGLVPSWTTSAKKLSEVLRGAPWSLMNPRPWQEIREGREILVAGGVRMLTMQHCGRIPGPCRVRKVGKCNDFHGTWEVYNPTLEELVCGTAAGQWVPVIIPQSRWMNRFWVRPTDRDLYAASVGGLPTEDDVSRGRTRAAASSISEEELDRVCRYGEASYFRARPREVFDQGQSIDASAVTVPRQQTPATVLDWGDPSHWSMDSRPCRHCRKPTNLVDDLGMPSHKVCSEEAS
ncbi:hypothetical protein ACISU4_00520 [Streptomyces wuyuanensis]|uniref:competence protein CoiA family protein n=1 Tax=Streptomyces wuyuanensis TaxID=1196353 RepID=UPI00382F84F8